MTLGEKIKICRSEQNMTQKELSIRTGIHHVSIRKYERGMMTPSSEHLKKIADALNVPILTFTGTSSMPYKAASQGELLVHLVTLYKSGLISITGTRDSDGMLEIESSAISLNPILEKHLDVRIFDDTFEVNRLSFIPKDSEMMVDFLKWERMEFLEKTGQSELVDDFEEQKEMLEFEILRKQDEI